MSDGPKTSSWWQTLPGVLTAITGVITAVAGLIAVLLQSGLPNAEKRMDPPPASSPTRESTSSVGGFAGTWDTITSTRNTYRMLLTQTGDQVSGSYSPREGRIEGTVNSGGILVYRWTEGETRGTGVFVLDPDGQTFHGSFSNSDDPNVVSGDWRGMRSR